MLFGGEDEAGELTTKFDNADVTGNLDKSSFDASSGVTVS